VLAVIGPAAAAARPPADGDPVVVVADPVARWAGLLAAEFWQQPSQRLRLIGVTGTNGKTTTTHLIEHLADHCGSPTALFGTLVNRWPGHSVTAQHTTAFADLLQAQMALAVEAGARIGAMEVSSHALDQQRAAASPARCSPTSPRTTSITTRRWRPTSRPRPACSRRRCWMRRRTWW
jgi:UDP-N-acetylmuramoyl-L-alanyl-D-glutamate--2,6-diaminopimelate ligase